MSTITIANRQIGPGNPPYVIAEISGNHNGDINKALELIRVAKKAGADAVKMQTYTADTMTIMSDKPDFCIEGGLWDGHTLYDLYQWAHTPWEWHEALFKEAEKLGITIFSSPFDETAVDFLEALNAPAYKIASFELTDIPLIQKVARTGKPMIMSTGMANKQEINEAISAAKEAGAIEIAILHCISGYPTPLSDANLNCIPMLEKDFDCVTGLSDHTLGTTAATTAIALGASIIEKHVTLDRNDPGPDAAFSLEPGELETLCQQCKDAYAALGTASYKLKPAEQANTQFRRSIYVVKDIKKGELFTTENVRRIRPGYGLEPKYMDQVLGSKAVADIEVGTPLTKEMLE